jgi:mannose-6-phosphate isomerase-like protein (cupin superfamily)
MNVVHDWRTINAIEDGCGGDIYKVADIQNCPLKNLELAMCIFPPGEVSKMHHHESIEEIYFILSGIGVIELDEQSYEVTEGMAVTIARGVKHRLRNTHPTQELRFLSVNSPEWLASDMIFDT